MKIAVMGAGAIGSYIGGRLARAGHDVTLVARPAHVAAIEARGGLLIDSDNREDTVPLAATADPSGVAGADLVLFTVKSADTEPAGRSMQPHLSPTATILCLQNGVDNAERLSAAIGRPAVAAVVYVATRMEGPGHVRHHGRNELVIGPSDASEAMAKLLTEAGIPTTVSETVRAALWQKLVLNCCYNALSAVAQLPYRRLFEVPDTVEVIRNVVNECMAVARALNIALPDDMFDQALAIARLIPDQYSSTAQDLARKKATEIDYLNGYIVRKGRETGVPTPANLTLHVMVKLQEAAM